MQLHVRVHWGTPLCGLKIGNNNKKNLFIFFFLKKNEHANTLIHIDMSVNRGKRLNVWGSLIQKSWEDFNYFYVK